MCMKNCSDCELLGKERCVFLSEYVNTEVITTSDTSGKVWQYLKEWEKVKI